MPGLRLSALFLFLAFAPIAASAQNMPIPKVNLTGAPSGIYTVDKNHASILFRINHLGFSLYPGRLNTFDAKINFDPAHPEKSVVDVTVDMTSFDVHNAKLEEELRSADWFDATKFPTATFHSTKITRTGADTGTMEGTLTMHGVTKPVTLSVLFHGYADHPMMHKAWLGFGAVGTIKRSDWGVSKGVPMVADNVNLVIEGEFGYEGNGVVSANPPPAPATAPSAVAPLAVAPTAVAPTAVAPTAEPPPPKPGN